MTLLLPLISVVTPVGPRHREHVKVAAASVAWQTLPAGWVEHLIEHDTDRSGPAAVRNRALSRARGVFVVALDADDYLIPTALETYLRGYAAARDACYVYADNYVINEAGWHYSNSQDYDQRHMARYNQHVVTALYPTALLREVGGWDEGVDIWEDWTAPLKLAVKGWCGQRLNQPALVYRVLEGERMRKGMAGGTELMEAVWQRYADERGQIIMCGCNKPAAAQAAQQQAQIAVQVLGAPASAPGGQTRLEYAGEKIGGFFVTSQATGRSYKLGGRRLVDADPADVDWLQSMGCVPVARAEFVPPPAPVDATSVAVGAPEPAPLMHQVAEAAARIATPTPEAAAALEALGAEPLPFELAPGPEAPAEDAETFTPKRMKRRA